jgi:hypothetical protein
MASINYFDSDMYNSTNTVVCFDEKDGNLYLRLRAMSHTIHAAKSEQNDGKVSFKQTAMKSPRLPLLISKCILINNAIAYRNYFFVHYPVCV